MAVTVALIHRKGTVRNRRGMASARIDSGGLGVCRSTLPMLLDGCEFWVSCERGFSIFFGFPKTVLGIYM